MTREFFVVEGADAWAVCWRAHDGAAIVESVAMTEYAAKRLAEELTRRARIRASVARFEAEVRNSARVLGRPPGRAGVRQFDDPHEA